ncbi:putative rhamnogalacturonate lyase C [Paramyrothecium foliicola]|nr:putative rhamnogalacturonate lyase C [Paramyrothecium foliicola]
MSGKVRIVCISDTHNDDCTGSLPDGDILIHAGDMTDDGTTEELDAAYKWIAALPHKVKIIIAGNHDLGLDSKHPNYLPDAVKMFTSEAAKAAGIHYIDRETREIPLDGSTDSQGHAVTVYGNPLQPDFLKSRYAFTYLPHPSNGALAAWEDAPTSTTSSIWVTHGGPQGHLDWIPIPPLRGCEVQASAVAKARPVLAVFGHFHISHGAEIVTWKTDSNEVEKTDQLVKDGEAALLDFTTPESKFEKGEKTIFVNAAWMTLKKTQTEERYQPIVLDLPASLLL